MPAPSVRRATPADAPAITAALVRAFLDDPIAVWSTPGTRRRPGVLRRWYEGRLRTLLPQELVWTDAGSRGAALWAPPDAWHVPPGEAARGALWGLGLRTPLVAYGLMGIERLHPRRPHLYLSILGVDPGAQGRGLGSALLAPALELCDRDHVGAYLESSKARNVDFYARHGFRVTQEHVLPRGPRVWLMWRDPR